jgi:hypothetical protein
MSPEPGTTVPTKDWETMFPLIGFLAARLAVAQAAVPGTPFGRQKGW